MSITVNSFLTTMLSEIRVARAGDVVGPDDMDLALILFNELLDGLNAEQRAIYTTAFATFMLTPALNPHTIGLAVNSPTWTTTIARPMKVKAANLLITSTIRIPLNLRDDDWWMNIRARSLASALPTDLLYSPDWPNGEVFLWPIPSSAKTVELNLDTLLAQVALTDTLDLPMGYQAALRLTLAELAAPHFGQTASADTKKNAREARARIWGMNDTIPNLCTRDAGMPGGTGGGYNFYTG